MAKRITNEMIMEALNGINAKLGSIEDRVNKLEKGAKAVPSVKGKGNSTASAKAEKTEKSAKYSTSIKDYEPKKSADGHYIWVSYKAKRKDYCYAVATKGQALGCYENGKKVADFADIKKAYNKAKADFDKKFPYTKKADR